MTGRAPRPSALSDRSWTLGALVVLGLVALAAALRLANLTGQSLWYDEGFSLVLSTPPAGGGVLDRLLLAPGSEKYQPGYFFVLAIWRSLFGDSETALRSLSVGLGILLAILVYVIGRRVYGRRHAAWALLLVAVSAAAVYYSQEVRPYALVALVAAIIVLAALPILTDDGPTLRARALFGLAVAVGAIVSIFLAILAASILLSNLFVDRDVRRVLRNWTPAIVLSVPVGLAYLAMFRGQPAGSISSLGGSILQNALFVPYGLAVGTTYGPPLETLRGDNQVTALIASWPLLALAAVVGLLLAAAVVRGWLRARGMEIRKSDRFLAGTLFVGYGLSLVFALVTKLNWQPRHSLFLIVPLALVIPVALRPGAADGPRGDLWATPRNLVRRVSGAAGVIAVVALLALNVVSLAHYQTDPVYARDDYRAVATDLPALRGPSGVSALLWGQPALLAYYGDHETQDGTQVAPGGLRPYLTALEQGADRLVLVINRPFYFADDPAGVLDEALRPAFRRTKTVTYAYVTVFIYERAPAALTRGQGGDSLAAGAAVTAAAMSRRVVVR